VAIKRRVSALHRKSGTCCFRQMSEFVGVSVRLIYAGVRVNRSCGIRKKHHIKSANRAFGYEKKLTEILELNTPYHQFNQLCVIIAHKGGGGSKKVGDKKDLYMNMKNLSKYSEWLDSDILSSFTKNAEYLIKKHEFYDVILWHKKLNEDDCVEYTVEIKTLGLNVSKVENTSQRNRIIEEAGVAMGLLVTQSLRSIKFMRVLLQGEGYDYSYISGDNEKEEKIEMTATEVPNEGTNRLNSKIRKFSDKFPGSSGYISVSCFPDRLQLYWEHKNDESD
jgi:hypothetical protein